MARLLEADGVVSTAVEVRVGVRGGAVSVGGVLRSVVDAFLPVSRTRLKSKYIIQ